MSISAGIKAPDFELPDNTNVIHKLSGYLGKSVILYFYPKDDTPGCTIEACNFRDDFNEFREASVTILGISPDTPEKHAKFKTKYNLPFALLADTDHKICELYGVWGRKKFMGKEYDGVFRTTFLINSVGIILEVFENVKPEGHSKEILKTLEDISK